MKYRLNVIAALEVSREVKQFEFLTFAEVNAAMNTLADMLLYLQDELCVMKDYSNMIDIELLVDGVWVILE